MVHIGISSGSGFINMSDMAGTMNLCTTKYVRKMPAIYVKSTIHASHPSDSGMIDSQNYSFKEDSESTLNKKRIR